MDGDLVEDAAVVDRGRGPGDPEPVPATATADAAGVHFTGNHPQGGLRQSLW